MAKSSTLRYATLLLLSCLATSPVMAQTQILDFYPTEWVGIDQTAPDVSSPRLRWRLNATSEKQAIFRMEVIGNGPGQIPPGSQIQSALLRLTPISTGDGWLYRATEPWDGSSTWNSIGDVGAIFSDRKPAGINLPITTITVTDHVALWASGTFNNGWVLKGGVVDTTDTEIYDGAAGDTLAPRLRVAFIPPDSTPPTVTDIDIGSTISSHPDYDVPAGSGVQIKTVPVAQANQVFVTFSENVTNVSASTVTLTTKAGAVIPTTVSYAANVATLQITTAITAPTKVVVTVVSGAGGVRDAAGNQLDGEWTNPASLTTASSKNFPSGDGAPDGHFVFYFTLLPGDYNVNNVADAADFVRWRSNQGITSGALFTQGDGDGDGDVDDADYTVWRSNFGVDQNDVVGATDHVRCIELWCRFLVQFQWRELMRAHFISRATTAVAVVAIGLLSAASVSADITYSWSGHMSLLTEATPDPWLIGPDGAEFLLQTTVSSTAIAYRDPDQIPYAQFTAIGARLWVDGEEALFVGDAQIDFVDMVDIVDTVTSAGKFSKFGQVVGISSVVGLDPATFSFSLPSEFPPYFDSRKTIAHSGVVRPYFTTVEVGTLVTVVPEPAAFLLAFGGFALSVAHRRRRVIVA